jgi:type IV pilus assembly protein PilO
MASESSAAKFDTFLTEKYIPLDDKIKLAIAVGILAGLLVSFYFVVFAPKLEEIKKLETKKMSLQADVDKAEKAAGKLEQHEAELAEVEKRFEKISIVLPKQKEIPALLRNISDRGTSAGLEFNTFTPGNETPKDFYAEIPINITIQGPYHNVGYFLDQVSKLDRIVTVNNIKMGSPKQEDREMLLSSSCNLLTYRFTNEQISAPPAK